MRSAALRSQAWKVRSQMRRIPTAMLSVPAAAGISILPGTATVARLRAEEEP
jgi:hypothetical protein